MISLTPKQDKGISIMKEGYEHRKLVITVAGVAGSGKSTIISYFVDAMGLKDKVRYVTFTGKASLVLQRKGLPATTIHKLIYDAYRNPMNGKFYFKLKPELDDDIRLIIIDEVSMVSAQLLKDLMSFGIPIIAIGDPEQLEPIGEDNGLLKNPDIFLDEIHRQAADNSIIRLSMQIRKGIKFDDFNDQYVKVLKKSDLNIGMLEWADQILCGRNNTRQQLNTLIRDSLYGWTEPFPEVGDKLICLRNYWDFLNDEGSPLINGTIGTLKNIRLKEEPKGVLPSMIIGDFAADYSEEPFYKVNFDSNIFLGQAPQSSLPNQRGRYSKLKDVKHEFDYGYVITTHKAQGSEWDKVLVLEEILRRDSHKRWLYSSVTRASKQLVLIKSS